MQPLINKTKFGSITVDGEKYKNDIYIVLGGKVKKRKKKLSKERYGTSHKIALDEIRLIYEKQAEGIIIGSGQYGVAHLSDEAREFLVSKNCKIIISPTPEAISSWNSTDGKWVGLFHITC